MKTINKVLKYTAIAGVVLSCSSAFAGNEDRVGSAGASQLLINPWTRGIALGDAGVASSTGLEATFSNIAGLAFTDKTQIKFNRTNWLGTAGIALNSAGLAQRISESSVISVSVQAMNFGDIMVTTVNNPEGGMGTFSPRMNVFNVGYARSFSSSIYGGINFKVLSENISNLKSTGIAIDAGIRYVTGEQDQIKFGIALKNVGPVMKYKGDGLSTEINYLNDGNIATLEQRSATYELPSLLNIGGSYDFIFSDNSKLTACGAFTANSFQRDQYRLGLDYGMITEKAAFNLRAGYVYEKHLLSTENRSNALTGFTAGFSVDALVGKNKSGLGLEYAMRTAGQFGIIHTFGISINLK
jgi:hypothetical protein